MSLFLTLLPSLAHTEGAFDSDEPHLLNSGTRDSARLLEQAFLEWAQSTNSNNTPLGAFALRGTLP